MDAEPTTLVIDRRGSASLRSRAVAVTTRALIRPYLARAAAVPFGPALLARTARYDRLATRWRPPRGTRTEPVAFEGFQAEWVHGPGVGRERRPVILYLHGGAWICCGLNTHRPLVARISAACGAPALSVDYRMIPVVRFTEEVEDCLAAYRWLLANGTAARDIVIMGDSAGGHLTFATALRALREGLPAPAALVALSPALDLDLTAKLAHANARLDPSGAMPIMERLVEGICAGLDPADPEVSPVRASLADLAGLPPVLLTAGSTEVLYCDAEAMARRLARAGVPCTFQVWDRQVHVFQLFGPLLPESRAAIAEIGGFVRAALAPRDSGRATA
ncbi:MAG TPA: alpha/beta hydrolase [Thermomonospora sp.]|nr:alpha/beta hydrolase [Thermomonospora sp.]